MNSAHRTQVYKVACKGMQAYREKQQIGTGSFRDYAAEARCAAQASQAVAAACDADEQADAEAAAEDAFADSDDEADTALIQQAYQQKERRFFRYVGQQKLGPDDDRPVIDRKHILGIAKKAQVRFHSLSQVEVAQLHGCGVAH